MKIEVLSAWYNEEFLAPLFLRHYAWADQTTILLEPTTNDGTRDEIARFTNVRIVDAPMPDGKLDDYMKMEQINAAFAWSDADWLVVVDADEFVFPIDLNTKALKEPRWCIEEANRTGCNVIMCRMWQVYRCVTDVDVDRTQPPALQRRHGDPDLGHSRGLYQKPSVVKKGDITSMGIGIHGVGGTTKPIVYGPEWRGAHWLYADPAYVYKRRLADRFRRLSKRNISFQGDSDWFEDQHLKMELDRGWNFAQLF